MSGSFLYDDTENKLWITDNTAKKTPDPALESADALNITASKAIIESFYAVIAVINPTFKPQTVLNTDLLYDFNVSDDRLEYFSAFCGNFHDQLSFYARYFEQRFTLLDIDSNSYQALASYRKHFIDLSELLQISIITHISYELRKLHSMFNKQGVLHEALKLANLTLKSHENNSTSVSHNRNRVIKESKQVFDDLFSFLKTKTIKQVLDNYDLLVDYLKQSKPFFLALNVLYQKNLDERIDTNKMQNKQGKNSHRSLGARTQSDSHCNAELTALFEFKHKCAKTFEEIEDFFKCNIESSELVLKQKKVLLNLAVTESRKDLSKEAADEIARMYDLKKCRQLKKILAAQENYALAAQVSNDTTNSSELSIKDPEITQSQQFSTQLQYTELLSALKEKLFAEDRQPPWTECMQDTKKYC